VLSLLAAGGALDDHPAGLYRSLPDGLHRRLAPELATAALAHGDSDGGARTLARRQNACVRVSGLSPIGLSAASLLAAAGIGSVVTAGPVTSAAPASAPPAARPGRTPDLVILADSYRRDLPAALLRAGIPHLTASASEAIGVVGPLVVPGRSACLRCLDLARADRDPAWPLILAQLAGGWVGPPACDAILAMAVAAQTAAQALSFVDRGAAATAAVNGTLELFLPGWQWRRRTWLPHPYCLCRRIHPDDPQ